MASYAFVRHSVCIMNKVKIDYFSETCFEFQLNHVPALKLWSQLTGDNEETFSYTKRRNKIKPVLRFFSVARYRKTVNNQVSCPFRKRPLIQTTHFRKSWKQTHCTMSLEMSYNKSRALCLSKSFVI